MPYGDPESVYLHFRLDGHRDQPAVLMLHSLGTDHRMWDAQVRFLVDDFYIIRPDLRGHGKSETRSPCSLDDLAEDVLFVMGKEEIPRAHVCGLSLGGMLALRLAEAAPDRVDRLVVANSATRIGSREMWDARIETVRREGMAAIADGVLARWFTPHFIKHEREAVAAAREMLLGTDPKGYAAACAVIRDTDLRGALAGIEARTLVIAGAQDEVTPVTAAEEIAEGIPGSELFTLDAAHLSNIEEYLAFTMVLQTFLLGQRD